MKNANITNINIQNNVRRVSRRGTSKTEGKKLIRCAACGGTGWVDILRMNKCTTCHGIGKVRA